MVGKGGSPPLAYPGFNPELSRTLVPLKLRLVSQHAFINLKRAVGHARNAVMLAYFFKTAPAQFFGEHGIAIDSQDSCGQTFSVIRLNQQSAARLLNNFREGAAS